MGPSYTLALRLRAQLGLQPGDGVLCGDRALIFVFVAQDEVGNRLSRKAHEPGRHAEHVDERLLERGLERLDLLNVRLPAGGKHDLERLAVPRRGYGGSQKGHQDLLPALVEMFDQLRPGPTDGREVERAG